MIRDVLHIVIPLGAMRKDNSQRGALSKEVMCKQKYEEENLCSESSERREQCRDKQTNLNAREETRVISCKDYDMGKNV